MIKSRHVTRTANLRFRVRGSRATAWTGNGSKPNDTAARSIPRDLARCFIVTTGYSEVINARRKARISYVPVKEHLPPRTVIGFLPVMTTPMLSNRRSVTLANRNLDIAFGTIDLECFSNQTRSIQDR